MKESDNIETREFMLATPLGRIYAKRWAFSSMKERSPIVLLHDSLGCVALWRSFPENLAIATGRDVYAYDRIGFGQSDPYSGQLDKNFVSEEAKTSFRYLSEALVPGNFIALGHSVGGGMAIEVAAANSDRCVAVITESAQAFVERRTLEGIREAKLTFEVPDAVARLRRYHGEKAEWVLSSWIDTWLAPEFSEWNLDAALSQVSCPVLAIHGDLDEYGSIAHPQRIATRSKGKASVEILEGFRHVPHREDEARVVGAIASHLVKVLELRTDAGCAELAE